MYAVDFVDISSSLEYRYSTQGGCLYIDSTSSELNLVGEFIYMYSCLARNTGGCIHIEPSLNK